MIFVLAGAISDEKSKRYLEILISKPVSRGNYIFAKFVTYLGVTKIVFILASLIFAVYTYSLFGSYPIVNFIIVAVLVLIYILLILSATLSISAMVSNSFLAAGGAIFFFFLINIFSALFEKFNIYNPVYILGNYQSILKNGWNNDFLPSSIVSIILIFVFIFIAIISFQRQEID
jgi:ABC-type transport system involved in multi-copper enzyme maturation permease subunit